MISRFFIDRPIFAAVLSILITLTGGLALLSLPMAQYPEITPPAVQVSIAYPGASARVVADTVAAPVEQQVNGVEGMLYLSSQSGNDGTYGLSVTFEVGTDLNTALVMVQNRVALAMPQLPTEVQMQGITIRKKTPDILMVVSFFSPGNRYDNIYLSNFATINVRDPLLRVQGVADINYLGQRDYSIRVWLDPQKMASCNLNAGDVVTAIRAQNVAVSPGQVGQPPAGENRANELPLHTLGRLRTPEQFGDVIVKSSGIGAAYTRTGVPQSVYQSGSTGPVLSGTVPGATTTGGLSGLPDVGQAAGLQTSNLTARAILGTTALGGSTNTASTGPIIIATPGAGGNAPPVYTSNVAPGSTTTGGASTSGGANTSGGASTTTGITSSSFTNPSLGNSNLARGGATTGGTVGMNTLTGGGITGGPPGAAFSFVRLRDVARIEMGAQNYNNGCTFDLQPSVGLAIHQLPGTNALDVANRVRQRMEELKSRFPEGVDYDIAYDTTPFIRESVTDVVWTLIEAVGLVGLVVLLFLQNWRAALIPLVAVPVAIIGTFAVMAALGFSLNNTSLFGLVLAIGIVVDDAIVVVENVERWLEHGLEPREAARRAMDEVTGPVIAIALVLGAVFVPCAFIGGITGQFFRQFAVTIAASTLFSAVNSLTLSPALAAILLRPHGARRDPLTWLLDLLLGWFFRAFNWVFHRGTLGYTWVVGVLLRGSVVVLLVYGGLLVLTIHVFRIAPTGFVPEQDQGRLMVGIELPDSASLNRTQKVIAQVEKIAHDTPGVAHTTTAAGMSLVMSTNSSNFGTLFVILDPFEKRQRPELSANAIMARLRRECASKVKDALVTVFNAPPIPGLSVASGFKLMVEDRTGLGLTTLQKQADTLTGKLRKEPGLVGVFNQFRSRTPQLWLDLDRTKAFALGVPLADVNQTMQVYLGSLYVNSFNEFGRYWQVTVQAQGSSRNDVSDVKLLEVRNKYGEMVPLSTVANLREVSGPVMVQRYNLYVAAPISGSIRPGVSSGEAIDVIDRQANETLPRSMGTEWTELMFLQIRAGNTAIYVFGLAVLFVFLALAALYESWSLPLAVILVVPLCLLCSLAGVLYTHRSVDIFVQIGLVVLVGLACKNAILIVEFAADLHRRGKERHEATLEAVRLRLRPILMTSLAFILGVVPLVIATGAGAEMRRSLGTAVFSGMLGVTVFGIFLTPVFFYVIQWAGDLRLFTSALAQWGGSALLGAALGFGFGYLLARLHLTPSFWSEVVGAVAGAVAALVMPVFWQRVRPWPADQSPLSSARQPAPPPYEGGRHP